MKKILVLADTHKNFIGLDYILPKMKESDYVIHLGDCESDMEKYKKDLGDKLISVKGNCDSMFVGNDKIMEIEGVKFLITHGNKYKVKNNMVNLTIEATQKEVDVVLYGHKHLAEISTADDIMYINPGTLESKAPKKTYVYLTVANGKVLPKIVEINC